MEIYRNKYHAAHLYLRIQDGESIDPSVFQALMKEYSCPLQVMVPSQSEGLVSLLTDSGFQVMRRCYEVEASKRDLLSCLPPFVTELPSAQKGSAEYAVCAKMMFDHYTETHAKVNPLTASLDEFVDSLPAVVAYDPERSAAAFLEGNEIAYVCSRRRDEFSVFAQRLLACLFNRYDRICFEADDTDWAAMALKSMFSTKPDPSFDTYVLVPSNICSIVN